VWRLDTAYGAALKVLQTTRVMMVRGGYAWVGRIDSRDPSPPVGGFPEQKFNSIVRVEIANGAETIWYYRPGRNLRITQVSSTGAAIVSVNSESQLHLPGEVRLVPHPGDEGALVNIGGFDGSPLVDVIDPSPSGRASDRLWFGNAGGLYLYTSKSGLRKVLDLPGNLPNGAIYPAGDCR